MPRLKAQKMIDPVEVATASSAGAKKAAGKLDEVHPPTEIAAEMAEFLSLDEESKAKATEAATHKKQIVEWAKEEFIKRQVTGHPGNFVLAAGNQRIAFAVKAQGAKFGETEAKTLTEECGKDAVGLLTPSEEVTLNMDVWKLHHKTLMAALHSKDDKGAPLVPDEVLRGLFYRTLQVKPTVVSDAVVVTHGDAAKLKKLLFENLKLTVSLTPR